MLLSMSASSVCHFSSSWQSISVSVWPHARNRCAASSHVVHAAKVQQQPLLHDTAHVDEQGPTVERRRAAFTYMPTELHHGCTTDDTGKQQTRLNPRVGQQQRQSHLQQQRQRAQHARTQQHKKQSSLQRNIAADDLDALAAQAEAVLTTDSTSSLALAAAHSSRPSLMYAVADVATVGNNVATALPVDCKPRYPQSDKLHLTEEAARDIARRLRKAGPPKPGQPLLRVFRYGIDDLRLYKSLDLAGLEGRVVVVDSTQYADVVITARNKRTGKAVNLAVARRAAAAAGIPYLQLKAVSPQRLLEALGPLLGLQHGGAAVRVAQQSSSDSMQSSQQGIRPTGMRQEQQRHSGLGRVLQNAQDLRSQPRLLRWEEVEGDGSEELLQLLWGPLVAAGTADEGQTAGTSTSSDSRTTASSSGHSSFSVSSSTGGAVVVSVDPRLLAWRSAQAGPCSPEAVLKLLRNVDVEDTRDDMVPSNPTERAGEKYKLLKPLRHGSRLKHKRLLRFLQLQQVPW